MKQGPNTPAQGDTHTHAQTHTVDCGFQRLAFGLADTQTDGHNQGNLITHFTNQVIILKMFTYMWPRDALMTKQHNNNTQRWVGRLWDQATGLGNVAVIEAPRSKDFFAVLFL